MNNVQRAGIVLAILGVLALAYGGFSYTKDTHQAKIGPLELSIQEKQNVNVPVWAGGGLLVAGVLMVVLGGRKS
jgi:uncharacterized membrane protein YidH (DUF202 family)